jgi:hypothetical protein
MAVRPLGAHALRTFAAQIASLARRPGTGVGRNGKRLLDAELALVHYASTVTSSHNSNIACHCAIASA